MSAYYNEFEPFPAARIRKRSTAGLIAKGVVDERDIRDIRPDELVGYDQVHLFAGGGAWSYALRLAGWPADRNVWTISCPCQPFSAAGQGAGFADERHLWPSAFHLVDVGRPDVIFGEQVASKDGLVWFDLVRADLEGAGYAVGIQDTCSAGVGAPNIRQRLYFVAERVDRAAGCGRERFGHQPAHRVALQAGSTLRLACPDSWERHRRPDAAGGHDSRGTDAGRAEGHGGLAACGGLGGPGPVNGFWRDADWLYCRDERWRSVEPGLEPLVAGLPGRVGRLREHGNAINVRVAAGFISDYLAEPLRLTPPLQFEPEGLFS